MNYDAEKELDLLEEMAQLLTLPTKWTVERVEQWDALLRRANAHAARRHRERREGAAS